MDNVQGKNLNSAACGAENLTASYALTGIDGLDLVLGGGLPRDRAYLVQGVHGAGKTTLSLQFCKEGASRGERSLYLTTTESAKEVHQIAASHGWSLDGVVVHYLDVRDVLGREKPQSVFYPVEVEHRERTRLATLLHDDLQQLLFAARLRLSALVELPPEEREPHLEKIDELLEECLRTSRNLTRELSPPVIQYGTVVEVLQWLGEWFRDKYGLQVRVEVTDDPPPAPDHLRVFLIQAVRELLMNVVKHSGSQEAVVAVTCRIGYLVVQVEVSIVTWSLSPRNWIALRDLDCSMCNSAWRPWGASCSCTSRHVEELDFEWSCL